jgi:hypothetical protein
VKAWIFRTVRNSDLDATNHEIAVPRLWLAIGSAAVIGLLMLNW